MLFLLSQNVCTIIIINLLAFEQFRFSIPASVSVTGLVRKRILKTKIAVVADNYLIHFIFHLFLYYD